MRATPEILVLFIIFKSIIDLIGITRYNLGNAINKDDNILESFRYGSHGYGARYILGLMPWSWVHTWSDKLKSTISVTWFISGFIENVVVRFSLNKLMVKIHRRYNKIDHLVS